MNKARRYMIVVRDGAAIAGYTSKRERKRIMPGEYVAIEEPFEHGNERRRSLRVQGGDMQGQGDLNVVLTEYDQLEDFPEILGQFPMKLLAIEE
ncbi:MAG: hypothetical protein U5L03_03785 [Burkholderiaceae bacterium]|nr:hypothetical protein [Burkholderiaceae bacterium]